MTTDEMLTRLPGEQPDFEELQEIIGRAARQAICSSGRRG